MNKVGGKSKIWQVEHEKQDKICGQAAAVASVCTTFIDECCRKSPQGQTRSDFIAGSFKLHFLIKVDRESNLTFRPVQNSLVQSSVVQILGQFSSV